MFMKKIDVRPIDVLIYALAIFFDTFGIALLLKTSFGATPYGIIVSSAALLIPLSVGTLSLFYESLYIFAASRIKKSRIKFELLVYSAISAVMLDLHVWYLPDMGEVSIVAKILITLLAVVFIDIAKALFNITIFPKLSVVEFIYAIVNRFGFRLDYVQKSISFFNVATGLILSLIAGQLFYNIGIGTVIAMVSFGTVLHWTSGPIEKLYHKYAKGNRT